MVKNYPAPNAGDYNAPTPHAAKVAQEPYTAPTGNTSPSGGASGGAGLDAIDGAPGWSPTPGEASEQSTASDV